MKTALHSVSYAGMWPGQAKLTLKEFLGKASELGFEAVMLMAKRPHLSVLDFDASASREFRLEVEARRLRVAVLAGYTDFALGGNHPEIPCREMQIAYVRELCKIAHALDCPLIRVFTSYEDATFDALWSPLIVSLRECARIASGYGVTLGVQNHHDVAVHHDMMIDLLNEVGEPNCKAMFDAWAPALQGEDLAAAVRAMAPYTVHTTVADYVRRPRFRYQPSLVNYHREADAIRAVPMGSGFIDYRAFFRALRETGYTGHVAYEMCSYLQGGGGIDNLDSYARQFLEFMHEFE